MFRFPAPSDSRAPEAVPSSDRIRPGDSQVFSKFLTAEEGSRLVVALLGAQLFSRGQIPMTLQQLMKQPTDSSTATAVGASASSKRKPDTASSFPALIVALQHSLKDALSNLASASSQDGRVVPIRPLVLFSSGPSLLMPKCVLGLRLPSLENDLNTEEGQRTRDPGLLERATLREFFKKELGNSIARTQTTVLLLAPRSFSQPGWLPRTNISHRLSSLVADEEPVSSSIPTRCKPLPKLIVERFAVTLTQQGVATRNRLEVSEQDDIQTGIEGDSRDWVWFMWEGGVVEGWKG